MPNRLLSLMMSLEKIRNDSDYFRLGPMSLALRKCRQSFVNACDIGDLECSVCVYKCFACSF